MISRDGLRLSAGALIAIAIFGALSSSDSPGITLKAIAAFLGIGAIMWTALYLIYRAQHPPEVDGIDRPEGKPPAGARRISKRDLYFSIGATVVLLTAALFHFLTVRTKSGRANGISLLMTALIFAYRAFSQYRRLALPQQPASGQGDSDKTGGNGGILGL